MRLILIEEFNNVCFVRRMTVSKVLVEWRFRQITAHIDGGMEGIKAYVVSCRQEGHLDIIAIVPTSCLDQHSKYFELSISSPPPFQLDCRLLVLFAHFCALSIIRRLDIL